ncbi:glycosyltransferase family 9 protein [Ectothiorhodospira mobilis]|uniref:glycosyltransferase family 9 protein n=1 Tax=Ectothiorhodospira mobilis TaxID=195064 RepID=UPI001EE93395|nr:glycosyltransferase family 9 protein [Ectothiorhodospira mobilis]MCG5534577.1 glycosyltransferase family 9 protein [Ectothiorhodospira mobilis]
MRRILVIRLSAIGDIVMASPLVHALRRRYPEAHIAWLVQPETRALLADHPELDEVILWPHNEWRQLIREKRFLALWRRIREFRKAMRARGFDLAIDLQGLFKSGLLAWLSGAKERVGLGSREGSQRFMTRVMPKGGRPELIGSEYRFLADMLGLPTADFRMRVGIGAEAARSADKLRKAHVADRPYAVICPFTTRPQKHWFNDHWAALVPRLRMELGLEVIMLGGPGDREAAWAIAERADVIDLVGDTSLQEAAAVIRGARLLVGVDTGLTHMGPAFDVPTVALFGSTCPYLETGRENTTVIYHDLPCAPCRRNPVCDGRFDCMTGITPEEVLQRVAQVMPHGEEST